MLSGIGPQKHLQHFDITLKQDLSLGQNIQDQLIVPIFLRFDKGTSKSESIIIDYLGHGAQNGLLVTVGTIDLVGFVNTENYIGYPDIEQQYFEYKINSLTLKKTLETTGFSRKIIETLSTANTEGIINIKSKE